MPFTVLGIIFFFFLKLCDFFERHIDFFESRIIFKKEKNFLSKKEKPFSACCISVLCC